jgi:hypothetical protein
MVEHGIQKFRSGEQPLDLGRINLKGLLSAWHRFNQSGICLTLTRDCQVQSTKICVIIITQDGTLTIKISGYAVKLEAGDFVQVACCSHKGAVLPVVSVPTQGVGTRKVPAKVEIQSSLDYIMLWYQPVTRCRF